MRSPFPGMDPYLEKRWSDVHVTLIATIKEALQSQLPAGLRARSEERVLLEEGQQEPTTYRSDIAVIDSGRAERGRVPPAGAAATLEPILVDFYEGPGVDRFVHIIDTTNGNRVITAIEVLSPWNKGPGRLNKDYLRKLRDYMRGEVNVVEIDLLRHPGRGRLQFSQVDLPSDRRAPYLASIRRVEHASRWEVYPMTLRAPLPRIPIPLRMTDPDIGLDLQPLIERVYTAGGHDDIDYRNPLDHPLDPEDEAWADQLLRAAGKR